MKIKNNKVIEVKDGSYLKLYSINPDGDQIFYNTNLVQHSVENGMHVIHSEGRKFLVSTVIMEKQGLDLNEEREFEVAKLVLSMWGAKHNIQIQEAFGGENNFITQKDFPSFNSPIYKYLEVETYEKYYKNGIWQFGTLEQYKNIENIHQQDPLEGFANVRLTYDNCGLSIMCSSSSNHYLFCGTDLPNSQYHKKFGQVQIKINNPILFAKEVARSINAESFEIKKVRYHALKLFKHNENIEPKVKGNRPEIDHNFLRKLSNILRLPSLFVKTSAFHEESEVRITFRVANDPIKPKRIINKSLNKLIEVNYL